MRYSSLTDRIRGAGADAWVVHDLAMQRRERGEDVIILSIGESDIDTPPEIVEHAVSALRAGRTRYMPQAGTEALRRAVATHVGDLSEIEIAPERVVFFPGAQTALYAVCQCILDRGDEVIVPEPTYVTYEAVIGSTGATIVNVPLPPERGFHLDPADVERAVSSRTRAVLLTSPHNPTGAVMTRDELDAVAEICRAHDLWLVCDEVYAELTYGAEHVGVLSLSDVSDRVVSVSSLSKSHSMTGWRAGWAIAPVELAEHLVYLTMCMLYGSPGFVQDAAQFALETPLGEIGELYALYERRSAAIVDEFSRLGSLRPRMPEGGMFVMLDVRPTGLSGDAFARRLLDEEDVSVLPGEGFGPSAAGHVRICVTTDEQRLREACRRIARCADRLAGVRADHVSPNVTPHTIP
ncbi:MAG TPA: pyridoxal phosphate-dependent aminotransferase [Gaiellales bacterium]|jgi:arginine:pyruvate transaminase